MNSSNEEVFDLAKRVAALVRALLWHPEAKYEGDDMVSDPSRISITFVNVCGFVRTTYVDYMIPLLPPNATKTCKALSNPWAFKDNDWTGSDDNVVPGEFPTIKGNPELEEKWKDANSRSTMIAMIIADPMKQIMFGGPFDFGKEVNDCAEAIYNPSLSLRPENVVKLATLSGNKQGKSG